MARLGITTTLLADNSFAFWAVGVGVGRASGSHGVAAATSPDHRFFSRLIPQRQQDVVNLNVARRYRQPTRSVMPSLLSWERHVRVQSRTPILGPVRALLALNPSANL